MVTCTELFVWPYYEKKSHGWLLETQVDPTFMRVLCPHFYGPYIYYIDHGL